MLRNDLLLRFIVEWKLLTFSYANAARTSTMNPAPQLHKDFADTVAQFVNAPKMVAKNQRTTHVSSLEYID